MHRRIAIAAALALGLLAAPGTRSSAVTAYAVGPGDALEIVFYAGGGKQEDFVQTVREEGTITCPLLGDVPVAGLSVTAIALALEEVLARDYFVDPQVLVNVKTYGGRIYVLGEVKQPGIYPIQVAPTALSACVLAGGFTDFAAPRHVRITRNQGGRTERIEVDLVRVKQGRAEDPALVSGDRVDIPRRRF